MPFELRLDEDARKTMTAVEKMRKTSETNGNDEDETRRNQRRNRRTTSATKDTQINVCA